MRGGVFGLIWNTIQCLPRGIEEKVPNTSLGAAVKWSCTLLVWEQELSCLVRMLASFGGDMQKGVSGVQN